MKINMSKKILTIVIPSYNTEKFIDKNIPTFLQDSILDDIEILIINDGSTDHTVEIAKKYEEKYPDTVHIVNKKNGGHGSVINKGIEIATGTYYKVVDGDDWVDTNNLCRFVTDLKQQDADLVINPYYFVYDGSGRRKLVKFGAPIYGISILFDDICTNYQKLPIHSITYKTHILRNNGIKVREKCFYEDNEYDLLPIPFVNTIAIYDYPIYEYLIAQQNQSVSDKNALKNHHMFYDVIQDCIIEFEKYKKSLSYNKQIYMLRTIVELIRSQYNIYLRNGFTDGTYEKMVKFNQDLKERYSFYFYSVAERYSYIKRIQNGKRVLFKAFALILGIYKKITVR